MKHLHKPLLIFTLLALILAPLSFAATPAQAVPIYTCLPTCEENDGRFLTIASADYNTLGDQAISFEIGAPPTATSIEIGIFDGNTAGLWDAGSLALNYTLYADPFGDGSGSSMVAQWSGAAMPDNAWFTVSVPTSVAAQSPSGNYFYLMTVTLSVNSNASYLSSFKVRTDQVVSLASQPFAFMVPLRTVTEAGIIYPSYPTLSPTTYDGNFDFHVYVPNSLDHFAVWDGDLDRGSSDLTNQDTDDADTPNNLLPGWANISASFEGVAVGSGGSTGAPSDDLLNFAPYLRSPSVFYQVAPLDLTTYQNDNPSGNREWEQFRIETNNATPADFYVVDRLPAGLYHMHLKGMDLFNLNAWRFPWRTIGVCPLAAAQNQPGIQVHEPQQSANPCKNPPGPYLIGDTVFNDANGDGSQGGGEGGIPGVVVQLYDNYGFPLLDIYNNPITAVTDANGKYNFNVEGRQIDPYTNDLVVEGVYTVRVAPENFDPGGALNGMTSTTGGEQQTNTVINANVLTYDFGYTRPLSLGTGTIGYWMNHPQAWPVGSITIGGVSYSKDLAIALMKQPGKGDKTYDLFAQLVAAKLNVLIGNEASCISADIAAADAWLAANPLGSNVKASSAAWAAISAVHTRLDDYNNGRLCAPHRN